MSSINILHASDLHISPDYCLRSSIDRLSDVDDPWDFSVQGVRGKGKAGYDSVKAFIKKTASSHHPGVLESLAEFIYANSKARAGAEEISAATRLDCVMLSGDLATTGRKGDIEQVRKFLSSSPNPKYPHKSNDPHYREATLAAAGIPIIFLPGNHDRFQPTNTPYNGVPIVFAPGGTLFDGLGADYRKQPVQKTTVPSQGGIQGLKVMILTADFSLRKLGDHDGRYGWLAQGRAIGQDYQSVLDDLTAETRNVKTHKGTDDVLCILWGIHFPPFFPGIKSTNRLIGEAAFVKAATQEGVHGILSGHTHEQLTYANPGLPCPVFCCGTTTQYEPRAMPGGSEQSNLLKGNTFQILNVSGDGSEGVRVVPHHYRVFGINDGSGQLLWQWRRVPT